MTIVFVIIGISVLAVAAFALWLLGAFLRRPPADSRTAHRKRQLFNPQAEDLTLQSADNVRLLSDEQIAELERYPGA